MISIIVKFSPKNIQANVAVTTGIKKNNDYIIEFDKKNYNGDEILIKENLQIIRPLLSFSKKRLISTCNFFNATWIEDSSNLNIQYERPRIRKELGDKSTRQLTKIKKEFDEIEK